MTASAAARRSTTPLDEFLVGDSSNISEWWRDIGLGLGLLGALAGAGLLAFLVWCHRGPRRDVGAVLTLVAGAGAVLAAGAVIELVAIAEQLGISLVDVLDVDASSAPLLRFVAGVLLLFGVDETSLSVIGNDAGGDADVELAIVGWRPGAGSAFGLAGAAAGLASFAFDGHTLTEGPRPLHAAVDVVHVTAGGVWVGGVIALAVLLVRRRDGLATLAETVVRFSRLAAVALVATVLAGVGMALMIVDDAGQLTGTDWGRRLLVKIGAVAVAASIAGVNHWVLVPRVRRGDAGIGRPLRAAVLLELFVLAFVLVVTLLLVTASTVAAAQGDNPPGTWQARSMSAASPILDDGTMTHARMTT